MDMWDFLKWRRTLRYTQAKAGELLGVNRATIQNWERGTTRISRAAELACQELTRYWKQRAEFGPVILVYSDSPIPEQAEPDSVCNLQCERFRNNDAAIEQVARLRRTPNFVNPIIIDEAGGFVWTSAELMRECDRRVEEMKKKYEAAASSADTKGLRNPTPSRISDALDHQINEPDRHTDKHVQK